VCIWLSAVVFQESQTSVKSRTTTKNNRKKHQEQEGSSKRPVIVIPYVEKVSETIARIMKKYNVPVAMKPWRTLLKGLLVHPKDKQKKEDITECVYMFTGYHVGTVTKPT